MTSTSVPAAPRAESVQAARREPGTAEERFLPGTVLAGRYRILAPLGRGGMGDVYRADDLKLGQPVALKFLSAAVEMDASRLARLLQEVRLARQISHANVCRVYDVGEVDGRHFLSMEYVDGEDLASLLRRIVRLPSDKAVELARQICAGLAAAHEQGILHRDLKPANVMIDGRGRAKISDFGLAVAAGDARGDEVRVGTPAYMAPEQRAGTEVTVRSDVYSLGLLLYEMFSGKEAFAAKSMAELDRLQQSGTPPSLTTLVDGLDPAVERIILRCLEPLPADRPASALAVAFALPGGDPLAAALAAGETPSPEMVAAAGGARMLSPGAATLWFAVALLGILAYGLLYSRASLFAYARLEKPPEVLAERAREIARRFGYVDPGLDEAQGFFRNSDALRWVAANDPDPARWQRLREHRPAAILYWHRTSPRSLAPLDRSGEVSFFDPSPIVSGMTWVQTDPRGRLSQFLALPPQLDVLPATGTGSAPAALPLTDWEVAFSEAGLDASHFQPVEPQWVPFSYADTRRAWAGEIPERPGLEVRVEAASYRGRITYVSIVGPWSRAGRMAEIQEQASRRLGLSLYVVFTLIAASAAAFLAHRNLRSGRGDRRGAFRLAAYVFGLQFVTWVLSASHVPAVTEEWRMFENSTAAGLYQAALVWVLYLALEPFVRRRWPESLIGWTRLLSGRVKDPRVGSELLVGASLGALLAAATGAYHVVVQWTGAARPAPPSGYFDALLGPGQVLASLLQAHLYAMNFGMFLFFFLFMGVAWSTRRWPGVLVFGAICTFMAFLFTGEGPLLLRLALSLAWGVVVTLIFLRAGLLGAMIGLLLGNAGLPLLFGSSWNAAGTMVVWGLLAALAGFGYWSAMRAGGRQAHAPG